MKDTNQILVKLHAMSKVYRGESVETHAVKDIDLEISHGEFLAICGPSGSGKSTLLSLLGTLETPSKGRYEFDGKSILRYSQRELSKFRSHQLGFVFQSFNLINTMTVKENVVLAVRCAGEKNAKVRSDKAVAILDRVGMSHRLDHFPHQLSGGQQQRVAIARALVNHPKMILADEPTGNLDSENSVLIMEMLKRENEQGATICMVTHDADISRWASRTVHMQDGLITKSH